MVRMRRSIQTKQTVQAAYWELPDLTAESEGDGCYSETVHSRLAVAD